MSYDQNQSKTSGATEREIEQAADKAHDTVDRVYDKAQQVAGEVRQQTERIGDDMADRANTATTNVGEKISDVAETIRQKAPTSGPIADAADTAADTLQRAGTYLQQQDLSDIRADLEGLIRRHPIESLLVGLGVGYLLARSMRR